MARPSRQPLTVRRTYKFRLYPTKRQIAALEGQLAEAARLYNAALQERRDAWRMQRKRITFYSQSAQLKDIRAAGDTGLPSSKVAADVLRRVDLAFQAFFRRAKSGQKPGFPRFRSARRYDSLGTTHFGTGIGIQNDRVRVAGVGCIEARWHRRVVGTIKTAQVRRDGNRWHVTFSVVQDAGALPASSAETGIDVGLAAFASMSDGSSVPAPRVYRHGERRLRRASRRLSRARRGSARRSKAVHDVRSAHRRVRNQRADFTHKLSRDIVNRYGFIAVEKLNIQGLARTRMAKSIHDAGWRLFLNQLAYKAESAGRVFVEVDPAGTSQTCICGERVPKRLKDRWHSCPSCGLDGPRDVISAQVILARGQRVQALTEPVGAVVCGGLK